MTTVQTAVELSLSQLSGLRILKKVQNTSLMHKALVIRILMFVWSRESSQTEFCPFLRRLRLLGIQLFIVSAHLMYAVLLSKLFLKFLFRSDLVAFVEIILNDF